MNERSVLVRLRAEVADYNRRLDEAAKHTRGVGEAAEQSQKQATTALGRMVQSATQHRQAWEQTGRTLTLFGTATVAALGASAMAAVRWESDWTGVLKTVDGTTEQLDALEGGLREMARTLPATHTEIAAVAEAAGQLGVRTQDILGFTRVMVDLGETTNLTAGEAATSIAQLMNVMRTAPGDVDRLGATLVALGNNGASTERDIVQMAQRIAGAGAIIGLTEDQTLALANALASVGIEVEAGGSAISRVLTSIAQDVSAGGVALDTWARVAGVSGQQFAATWKGDPAEALTLFVSGLGRMQAAGEDVFGVLDELGMSDVRVSRALLSMATSGDLLAESFRTGAQAWEENTALAEEAGKRYDTTAAKIEIARNNINDAAISLGENLLPALAGVAEATASVAEWFGQLPEPLQSGIAGMAGITGAAALMGGAFLLTVPRIVEMQVNLRKLRADGSAIPGVMRGVGRAAGVMAAAAAGFTALTAGAEAIANRWGKTAASVEETTQSLLHATDAADLDSLFSGLGIGVDEVESFEGAVRRITSPDLQDRIQDVGGSLRGIFGGGDTGRTRVIDQFKAIGDALGSLVESGHAEEAARQYGLLEDAWTSAGGTVEELRDLLPGYTDALADSSNQEELAQGSTDGLTESYNALAGATEWLTEEQAAWRDEIAQLDAAFVDSAGAWQGAIDKKTAAAQAYAESTKESVGEAADSWEDYYDGFSVSLDEYLAQLQEQVDAQNAWETNMVLLSGRVSQGVLDELARMGPEGAPLVAQLVTASDEQLAQMETLFGERASGATGAFASTLDGSAAIISAAAAQLGTDAAAEIAAKLAAGTATVQQIMYEYGLQIEGVRPQFDIDTTNAVASLDRFVQDAAGRKIYVDILGRTTQVVSGPGNYVARAGGGPIFGPGTETSDSIPSLLSTNEHVWSAAEVKGAGGHLAVAELRALARSGTLHAVQTMRFADGGSPAFIGSLAGAGRGLSAADLASAMSGMSLSLIIPGTGVREVARVEAASVAAGAARDAAGRSGSGGWS
jgi:TP901 family phage tail tape measure protein